VRLELDLPFRIESLNRGQRLGLKATIAKIRGQRFAQRGKVKRQRNGTHMVLKSKLPGQLRARLLREGDRLVITLTRIGPGTLDSEDNLAGGFKAVRDGIADALGVNDRHPRLRWFYGQERGGPRVYGARVLFETMTVDQVVQRLEAGERARA
jgi:hypothetical protein